MGLKSFFKRTILGEATETPRQKALAVVDKAMDGKAIFSIQDGGLWEVFEAATKLSARRIEKYRDYDLMEDDSLLASALELMTDDACQFSMEKGTTIWPAAGADAGFIKKVFRELDIENRVWGWAYNVAKYGDFFLGIVERDGKFVHVEESIHPKNIKRVDIDGKLAAFATVEDRKYVMRPPWRYIHFINNYKPTFERTHVSIGLPHDEPSAYSMKPIQTEIEEKKDPNIRLVTARYGTSVLEAARKVYKILNLLEQSLALARLNRSPLIRVFYINTEGMTTVERDETVLRIEKHFKEQMAVDMRGSLYRADFKPLSFNADIFIPYASGKGDVRIETIGGDLNIKDIADIKYLKNKMFAALRIPQGFLGFEEALPGGLGSTTLTRLDIRYARMVKKIQRAVISGVQRLLTVIYAYEKGKTPKPKSMAVKMETISGVEELDRMSALERKVGVAQQFIGLMRDMEGSVTNPIPIYKYAFGDILGLAELDLKFKKRAPEGEEGGEGGGRFASYEPPKDAVTLVEQIKSGEVGAAEIASLLDTKAKSPHMKVDHSDIAATLPQGEDKQGAQDRIKDWTIITETDEKGDRDEGSDSK